MLCPKGYRPTSRQRVHTLVLPRSFAFLPQCSSLVKRDHEDVCPLSHGIMFPSLFVPLQSDLRFFLVPVNETLFQPPLPFGSSVKAISACSNLRSLSQIQISSSYQLSSTSPVYGHQKDTFLTIGIPHPTVLRYIVRAALYSGS